MSKIDLSYTFKQVFSIILKLIRLLLLFIPKIINSIVKRISKRLRFSITFKSTTFYTLLFSSILLILEIILVSFFNVFIINNVRNSLKNKLDTIPLLIDDYNKLPEEKLKKFSQTENISITIFNDSEDIYYTTEKDKDDVLFIEKLNSPVLENYQNYSVMYINKKIEANSTTYYLQLSKSLKKDLAYKKFLIVFFFFYFISAILITISRSSKTMKKMLLPIYTMTETAKSISAKALNTRLNVGNSHDELKDLAETFNEMLDRIEASYEQQNQFVSDASHELRTPISVIQGYANLLSRWGKDDKSVLEESIEAIKVEADNMKELVEKLLFLARADKNTQKIEKTLFQMNELIQETIKETKLIDSTIHNIINEKNAYQSMNADRKLIKQALRIFIDNSLKYTAEGGTIKIDSYIKDNYIVITIEDNGVGISKEDLPNIFNRFYRCDKSRTKDSGGTGLGLSIAKWIIGKHDGLIEVESALNKGTKIYIYLPTDK